MIKGIQSISFGGIYDLKVPQNTPQETIDKKVEDTKRIIAKTLNIKYENSFFDVKGFDDRIRIVTSVENPWLMASIFEAIGGTDLAVKYMKNNTQEYKLDIQA